MKVSGTGKNWGTETEKNQRGLSTLRSHMFRVARKQPGSVSLGGKSVYLCCANQKAAHVVCGYLHAVTKQKYKLCHYFLTPCVLKYPFAFCIKHK